MANLPANGAGPPGRRRVVPVWCRFRLVPVWCRVVPVWCRSLAVSIWDRIHPLNEVVPRGDIWPSPARLPENHITRHTRHLWYTLHFWFTLHLVRVPRPARTHHVHVCPAAGGSSAPAGSPDPTGRRHSCPEAVLRRWRFVVALQPTERAVIGQTTSGLAAQRESVT